MENYFHTVPSLDELLNSDFVTQATCVALQERLAKAKNSPHFFNDYYFSLLSIVCDRLMGQNPKNQVVNIALFIDERLAENTCDGWRYDALPPDDVMLLQGLAGIDETAQALFGTTFIALKVKEQKIVLKEIQKGTAAGNIWSFLPSSLFFEELLAEATEIFYSYPVMQLEIGYAGMADAKGWEKIGLNQSEGMETIVVQ